MLVAIPALLPACHTRAPAPAPPRSGLVLSGVEAWHHEGTTLRAHATARRAVFSEGLAQVSLRQARIDLTRESLRFAADQARIDLGTLDARGTGQVTLGGPGFVARSDRFRFEGRAHALELGPPVHVETRKKGGT